MKNQDAYDTLETVLQESAEGFYVLIASPRMQRSIARRYQDFPVKIYDFIEQKKRYRFKHVIRLLEEKPGAAAYFFLNMQDALQDEIDIENLNFSRDVLAQERKNLIFCMTRLAYERTARIAHDWFSFIKLRMVFEDEAEAIAQEKGRLPGADEAYQPEDVSQGLLFPIDWSEDERKLRWRAGSFSLKAKELRQENRYKDALSALESARKIREKLLGEKDRDTAVTYDEIAQTYYDMGRYEEALEYFRKSMTIREQVLSSDHLDLAASYHHLGSTYANLGRPDKALDYFRRALEIQRQVMLPYHPDLAASYHCLGSAYAKLGQYDEALKYFRKALSICEESLPPEHPLTSQVKENLKKAGEDAYVLPPPIGKG